jgi:co-chaperonin GroES (HSP10)|tara:strand:- start:162 stop:422 length:261 start_codon:yes stop_codon:yes gene_type:complete
MKAIGRNLIIQKTKAGTTTTKGGLMLAENQREDIRYIEAEVISIGSEVVGVKKGDLIYYDVTQGFKIEIKKLMYHVIKLQDVVVVL